MLSFEGLNVDTVGTPGVGTGNGTGAGPTAGPAEGAEGTGTPRTAALAGADVERPGAGTGTGTLGTVNDLGAAGPDSSGGAGILKPITLAFLLGEICGTGGAASEDGATVLLVLRGLRGATATGVGAAAYCTAGVVYDSAPAGVGTAIVSDGCSLLWRPTWNCDCAGETGTGMFSGVPSLELLA